MRHSTATHSKPLMRKCSELGLVALLLTIGIGSFSAQHPNKPQQLIKNYVINKNGLSLFSKTSKESAVLANISFGDSVLLLYDNTLNSHTKVVIDSIPGAWARVKYKGKEGFVSQAFLLYYRAPRKGIVDMVSYMKSISSLVAPKKEYQFSNQYLDDYTLTKFFFKNGMECHKYEAYETIASTYFLPNVGIEQGYALVRLFKEFELLNNYAGKFPEGNLTYNRQSEQGSPYEITTKIDKEDNYLSRIDVNVNTGGFFDYSFYYQYGVLAIVFSNYI